MRAEIQRALISFSLFLTMGCQPPGGDSSSPAGSISTTTGTAASFQNTIVRSATPSRTLPFSQDNRLSYCESKSGQIGTYSGVRDLTPYPLASLSKLFVTAWALKKLGPDYRFKTQLRYRMNGDGTIDAALTTGYDPVVNIEKIFYLLSLLEQKNIQGIRNLYIDTTTRVYISVLNNPHTELVDVPVSLEQSVQNLGLILNSQNWAGQSAQARQNLKGISIPTNFFVRKVQVLLDGDFKKLPFDQVIEFRSAILAKYLKNINTTSNNYITDALFQFLGGESEFLKFQISDLGVKKSELVFRTGSGLPLINSLGRFDNMGSCYSVLKTLKYLDLITKYYQINLGHLLLTAGLDQGTYDSQLQPPVPFNKNVVFKTGRLYDVPTLNLAGLVSLKNGQSMYFATMFHDFDNLDEVTLKNQRDQLLAGLLKLNPTEPNYLTMPLDTLYFKP